MSYSGEADEMLYKQDREDKRREMLERRGRMGGPEAPEDCGACNGEGMRFVAGADEYEPITEDCPHCLGTGVQP